MLDVARFPSRSQFDDHIELEQLRTPSGEIFNYIDIGSGRPLVFVHGLPGQATDFLPLLELLSAQYRGIAYDRIGYGGSRAPSPKHVRSVEDNVPELISFLDALSVDQAVLAGWSFGMHIAMDAAVAHPNRVTALISLGGSGPSFTWPNGTLDKLLFKSVIGRPLIKLVRAFGEGAFRASLDDAFGGKMPDELVTSFHKSLYAPGMIETWLGEGRNWKPSTSKAKHIEQPLLILHGDEDTRIPVSVALELHATVRTARLEILEGVGHWPFASHPELVAQKCQDYLKSIATSSTWSRQSFARVDTRTPDGTLHIDDRFDL